MTTLDTTNGSEIVAFLMHLPEGKVCSTAPHAIAAYFTLAARQAAASATYATPTRSLRAGTYRRTRQGCCPVGLLLQADGCGSRYSCPDSAYAASAIYARLPGERDKREGQRLQAAIGTAVADFNTAWDAGEIVDLAAALGVARERPSPVAKSGAGDALARKVQRNTPLPATGILARRVAS